MIDLDALEKLARAATQGPWFVQHGDDDRHCCMTAISPRNERTRNEGVFGEQPLVAVTFHQAYPFVNVDDDECGEPNSAFIAAANPETVLHLIALARTAADSLPRIKEGASASKEAEQMREAIIAALPGGSIADPQQIADMIRGLPAIPVAAGVAAELTDDDIIQIAQSDANLLWRFSGDDELIKLARAVLAKAAPVADQQERIAALEAEVAKWKAEVINASNWLWREGPPPHPWKHEWFVALTIYGDRVVLRSLEEGHNYDYTTADGTYMKEKNIRRWAQFPDSDYIAPGTAPAAPVVAASEGWIEIMRRPGMPPNGRVMVEVELRDGSKLIRAADDLDWSYDEDLGDIMRWRHAPVSSQNGG